MKAGILIKFKTKTQLVYEHLRREITTGRRGPGERIVSSEVAQVLGVSEIPVREALKLLESEGFVQMRPHAGATVAPLDIPSLSELLAMRGVLEALAARYAAEQLTRRQIAGLRQVNEALKLAAERGDSDEVGRLNREFHLGMYRPCETPRLYKTIVDLYDASARARSLFALAPERMQVSAREHEAILDAVERRDGEAAERLVRQHKEAAWRVLAERLEALLDRCPDPQVLKA